MHPSTTRRHFLKSTTALTGGLFAPNLLFGKEAPAALNVAAIGCGGKGRSDISEIAPGNRIAFLCDVDKTKAGEAMEKFPDARFFSDYREMFAEVADKIDVVTVSTPDHMHFPIAMEAIRLGKPVMVQKPLSNNLWETRALANYAKEKGVLTVMGNQGATMQGTRLLREWIEAGLIGEVKEVHYWTNRPIWPQGPGIVLPPAPVPETLNWDVWQGTCATDRPYSKAIHPFAWRGFWDYGCGALGDIGCHCMNSAFWALDLKGDFVVESSKVSEFDDTFAPKRSSLVYHFPAKGKRAAVKVFWQDGVTDPNTDKDFVRPPGLPADVQLNPRVRPGLHRQRGHHFLQRRLLQHRPGSLSGFAHGESPDHPESLRARQRRAHPGTLPRNPRRGPQAGVELRGPSRPAHRNGAGWQPRRPPRQNDRLGYPESDCPQLAGSGEFDQTPIPHRLGAEAHLRDFPTHQLTIIETTGKSTRPSGSICKSRRKKEIRTDNINNEKFNEMDGRRHRNVGVIRDGG